mmetsp:Transcript_51607/g.76975  ORF Transcript_51607/g.76975 Transcript_51607/m.76975 type:complete len:860 (-) Transcript_51607:86-2665(-)
MTVPSKPAFDPDKHLLKNKKEKKSRRESSRQRDIGEDRPPSSSRREKEKERRTTKSPPIPLPEGDEGGGGSGGSGGGGGGDGEVRRRKPTEDDDAAIARALQEQLLEEEHNRNRQQKETHQEQQQLRQQYGDQQAAFDAQVRGTRGTQMEDDMQLMLMMQRQEMEAAVSAGAPRTSSTNATPSVDDMELARQMQQAEISETVQSGYQNQLDYARRIQQQAFADARRTTSYGDPPGHRATSSGETPKGESDAELARRMQELEQLGMGRLNSDKNIKVEQTEPSSGGRSRQEEEDARLARMMAEAGGSFRDIRPPSHSRDSSNVSAPPPPPSRNAIAVNAPPPPSPGRPSSARNKGRSRTPPPPRAQPVQATVAGGPDPFGRDLGRSQHGSEPAAPPKEKKKRGFFGRKDKSKDTKPSSSSRSPSPAIPAPIPPPPGRSNPQGPIPYSTMGSENVNVPIAPNAQHQRKKGLGIATRNKPSAMCSACQRPASSFLVALDKKYHAECFKCVGCHLVIDSSGPFAYMADEQGDKHPLHRKCYAELYGVKCAVCKQSIPAGPDGNVSFVKHPFFDTEQMCPRHASNPGRRCTGCHRFEPDGEPFADLNDSGRCACFSCCRSVVVDSSDAEPLWKNVVSFFEHHLKLPIWKDMRKVPILVVGYDALNDQLMASGGAHGGSSQIMTRGLCLTEHQSGRRFKLSKVKYNTSSQRFEACDVEEKGFTFFQVPDASKVNPDASVTAILCLSGLPKDLAASVLAHEALHAWIKLHPRFDIGYPIPPQVEEGCAQLIAMLYLTEGLDAASTETYGDSGPSDEKLRQYFKFSIETDDHEIYGEGYRRAAQAYANIGVEALLSHVVRYRAFPKT